METGSDRALASGGGGHLLLAKGAEVRGKPISFWIRTGFVPVRKVGRIENHFPTLNSNALPYLVKALRAENGPVRRLLLGASDKLPPALKRRIQEHLATENLRLNALLLLRDVKPNAVPAIPEVVRVLASDTNTTARVLAIQCLVGIDRENPTVMKALTEAAFDTNFSVRAEAIWQLRGRGAPDIVPREKGF